MASLRFIVMENGQEWVFQLAKQRFDKQIKANVTAVPTYHTSAPAWITT